FLQQWAVSMWIRLSVMLLLLLGGSAQVAAQQAPAPIRLAPIKAAVYVSPPFVMKSGNGYAGFTWELWQQIGGDLGLTYDIQEVGTVPQLLQLLREKRVDVAVANLTITASRYETIDFTQPYFDAGLRVMIDEDRHAGMANLMTDLRQSGHLRIYAWLGVIILA